MPTAAPVTPRMPLDPSPIPLPAAASAIGSITAPGRQAGLGLQDAGLYAVVVFSWSTSWIALKLQLGVVAPEVSLVYRFAFAASLMWIWLIASGQRIRYPLATHARFAALGAFIFSINFLCFYLGGKAVPSGLLAVVFSLASVFNLLLSSLFFRTRIEGRIALGAGLGTIGILLMYWPEMHGATFDHDALIGLGLCIAGTLCFCLGNMISTANSRAGIAILPANAWGMVYGTALLAMLAIVQGKPFIIEMTPAYLGSLAWLAVLSSFAAFAAYMTLLSRIGAARAGYATVLFPVFALVISTLVEGYQWSVPALTGLALVLVGNIIVLLMPRPA